MTNVGWVYKIKHLSRRGLRSFSPNVEHLPNKSLDDTKLCENIFQLLHYYCLKFETNQGKIIIFIRSPKNCSSNYSITLQLSLHVTHSVLPCSFTCTCPCVYEWHTYICIIVFSSLSHIFCYNHKSFTMT